MYDLVCLGLDIQKSVACYENTEGCTLSLLDTWLRHRTLPSLKANDPKSMDCIQNPKALSVGAALLKTLTFALVAGAFYKVSQ